MLEAALIQPVRRGHAGALWTEPWMQQRAGGWAPARCGVVMGWGACCARRLLRGGATTGDHEAGRHGEQARTERHEDDLALRTGERQFGHA